MDDLLSRPFLKTGGSAGSRFKCCIGSALHGIARRSRLPADQDRQGVIDLVSRALSVLGIRPAPVALGHQPAHSLRAKLIATDAHFACGRDDRQKGLLQLGNSFSRHN